MTAGPAAAEEVPPGFAVSVEPTGSGTVVEAAHAPDGRRFLAEKGGRVKTLHPDGRVTALLDLRAKVNSASDRGLLGIAVDDEFATNGWLYLLFSQELDPANPDSHAAMTSALTRVTVRADSTVADPTSIGTYILGSQGQTPCPTPADTLDCMPADHYWHSIGTVRVDPTDGTLWVGSGDAHVPTVDDTSFRPYDETNTAGKILHIDKFGRGLAGHPFCPDETDLTRTCTKIYAKGFRNPFRFTLRPGKGPVVGDVGHALNEEINLIRPGLNYGWPCYEGLARPKAISTTPTCVALYAKEGTADGSTPPSWHYPRGDGASVIGGPVYRGDSYPADMKGDIFVGDYVQGWVKRLEVDAQDRVTAVHDFSTGWTGVSLVEAPNGELGYVDMGWVSGTPAFSTYRYTANNATPTAAATATPSSGASPLTVSFSSAGSSDPEGGTLTYEWDFGDGSARDTTANPDHVYVTEGTYTATLTVRDPQGAQASATVVVTVGDNAAPTVSIESPTADFRYSNGVSVDLAGSATDEEDGALDGGRMVWDVLVRHGTHLHEVGSSTGSTSSFVPLTDHDADSEYVIRLTATDSGGASATVTRTIKPRTVQLTLASSPPGVELVYDGRNAAAPAIYTSAVGFRATIEAPPTADIGGVNYVFAGWSDGGEGRHNISVPDTDTTLTATYTADRPPTTETLRYTAVADTYVDARKPTVAYGSRTRLLVDGSPEAWALTRFDVSGLAGRTVTKAVLRIHETDASASGGRVRAVAGAWSESTTWNTRPSLGVVHASLNHAVSAGTWYEVELPTSVVTSAGGVDLALDTLSSDGHYWASREETATPPQLLVTVSSDPPPPPPPPPSSETLSFAPTADTYVDSGSPTTSYGTRSGLRSDASPTSWSLTRFDVQGLAGRTVTKVVLRGYETDASVSGGRVRAVSGTWSENTTWDTRPVLGVVHASLAQPVSAGTWYEIELPTSVVTADGSIDLGLDTTTSDAHIWASRHTNTPPQLRVTVSSEPAPPPPPPPTTETLPFTAVADTYVDAQNPTVSYGARSTLRVDGSPEAWSLARFDVRGLAGRTVTKAVLRLHETDASASGGRVRAVSGAWSETTTWDTRPSLGVVHASLDHAVSAATWYEVELPVSVVTGDGGVDLALDSLSSDGHYWSSRSSPNPPQLIITVSQ